MTSRWTPITPTISPRWLRSGTLVVGGPGLAAVQGRDVLLAVDHWTASLNDVALVGQVLLRQFRRQQVEVGLADQLLRRGAAEPPRGRHVGDDETAPRVLDPQRVRHGVDQRLNRALLLDRQPPLGRLGDVLVDGDPAAVRRRRLLDSDRAAVRQRGDPAPQLSAGVDGGAFRQIVLDAAAAGSRC